ncbi:MAG: hypothetical protein EHM77_04755, partial [Planctomycetaceae bacterium]
MPSRKIATRTTRPGFTLIELTVAATLVIAGLTVLGSMTVATGRMWQQTRQERVANEELSNQLERLMALTPAERSAAISDLRPSAFATQTLVDVTLVAKPVSDAEGERIELAIDWDRGTPGKPLSLVGWT